MMTGRFEVEVTTEGARKVALLLLSMDRVSVARILQRMSRQEKERIALELAWLEVGPALREESERVLREFHALK